MERELVIVPTCPRGAEGDAAGGVAFEVRRLTDGTEILPVFSTINAMVRELGQHQPWVRVPMSAARDIGARAGLAQVVLDPVLGEDAWRWDPARIAAAQVTSAPGQRAG